MSGPAHSATLDIDALRAFVAVAELGGVTAAAERVGRTPAAVSMQLKKLEETIGRTLFDRRPRGMEITRDGERLKSYASRILRLHGEALSVFRERELMGDVRIGMIEDFCQIRLANVLRAFSETHCCVGVKVVLGATAQLYPQLDRGELDLALLTPGSATEWRDDDIPLHEEPLVWVGRRGGRARHCDPLPVALADSGCAWRQQAIASLRASQRTFTVAYASDFNSAIRAAVSADLAVAPIPRSLVEADQEILGAEHGLAPIGFNRVALRFAPGPRGSATAALADHIRAELDLIAPAPRMPAAAAC